MFKKEDKTKMNDTSFEYLYKKYLNRIVKFINVQYDIDFEASKDVAHEVFKLLWEKHEELYDEDEKKMLSWLYEAAKRKSWEYNRSKNKVLVDFDWDPEGISNDFSAEYEDFINKRNEKAKTILDPNSEDAKCLYLAHCKRTKGREVEKLKEQEEFSEKVRKEISERIKNNTFDKHQKTKLEKKKDAEVELGPDGKPVDKNKLSEALEKAVAELSESDKKCFNVTGKNKILRIRLNEIKYIESFSRKIIVHETRRNTELLMKLDDFEKELPPYFLRIHKSYSVNMNMIRSINNNRIELFSGEVIPVAKAKYPEIKKNILAFLSSQL